MGDGGIGAERGGASSRQQATVHHKLNIVLRPVAVDVSEGWGVLFVAHAVGAEMVGAKAEHTVHAVIDGAGEPLHFAAAVQIDRLHVARLFACGKDIRNSDRYAARAETVGHLAACGAYLEVEHRAGADGSFGGASELAIVPKGGGDVHVGLSLLVD